MRRALPLLALLAAALAAPAVAAEDALAAAVHASAGVTGSGQEMRLHLAGRTAALGEEVEGWRLVGLSPVSASFSRDGQTRTISFDAAAASPAAPAAPSRVTVAGSLLDLMADYEGTTFVGNRQGLRHGGAVMFPGDQTPDGWKLVGMLQGGVVFGRGGQLQSFAFDAAKRPTLMLPPGQVPPAPNRDLLPLTQTAFPTTMGGLDDFARYAYYRIATINLGDENKLVNGPGPLPNEVLIPAIGADAYIDYNNLLLTYRPPDPTPQAFVPVGGGEQVMGVVNPDTGRIAWLDRRDPGPIQGTTVLRPDRVVNALPDEVGLTPVAGYQFRQLNSSDLEIGPDGQTRLKATPSAPPARP